MIFIEKIVTKHTGDELDVIVNKRLVELGKHAKSVQFVETHTDSGPYAIITKDVK